MSGIPERTRAATGADRQREEAGVTVRVRLFGIFRQLAGTGERTARLPAGSTAGDLVAALRGREGLDFLPERPALAVNREYADPDRRLRPGDEVALIPPVSGGSA